ncbi:MAG: transcriptional regulator, partial [Hallella bergensis]
MRLIIVIFSFFVAMNSTAQVYWQRLVTNYSKQQYLCGNQNWQISQHANGWMYFANNKGLLEYDGVYWNTYSLNHDAKARAVKAMGDRVYVGGLGQFGFFEPDVSGQLKYTDLLPKQNSTAAINIWHIHSLDGKIYFQSDDGMYVYYEDKLHYIPCAKGISYSVVLYERLYAVSRDGIFLLSNNSFQLIPGSEMVTHDQVISLMSMDGNILAVTAHKGLFISSGGTFKPYRSKLDEFISGNQISSAAISTNFLSLGTIQ